MLEDAMNKKPKIEKLANEVSGYFSVTILTIGIATFSYWYFSGASFEKSLLIGISVIVIACPCALGLATPIATLVGISIAAKKKIIFKESSFLETMAKADVVLVDKTGTLTQGQPKVIHEKEFEVFDKSLLYSLLHTQTHPISIGVREFLYEDGMDFVEIEDIKNIQAKGIKATYDGKILLAGSPKLLEQEGIECDEVFDNSVLIFCIDKKIVSYYELQDRPKKDVKQSIARIKKRGLEVVMLTGDNQSVASKIATSVGIDEYHAFLTPVEKADFVKKYHDKGKKVIFAGDGINDCVALGLSDIAVSMGNGAQIAVEVSDVVLLDNQVSTLANAIELSANTYKNIKQNLFISLSYNAITIPLAMMGYVLPIVAALVMSLSSLFVVGNSLRRKLKG